MKPQKEKNNFSKKPKKKKERNRKAKNSKFFHQSHTQAKIMCQHNDWDTHAHDLTTTQLHASTRSGAANSFLLIISSLLNHDHKEYRRAKGAFQHFLIPLQGATLRAEIKVSSVSIRSV